MRILTLAVVLAAMTILWSLDTEAREAGDWIVRGGISHVAPKSNNGTVPPATRLDASTASMLTFDGTYMVTANVGIELLAALPFEHDVYGKSAGTKAKLVTVKQLPPTLSAVYTFNSQGAFQPYLGAGVNWTIFFDETEKGPLNAPGVNVSVGNSVGLAAVVGIDVPLTERMFLNGNIRWMDIDAKVRVNGDKVATAKIDPLVYALNIGWRF